MSTATLEANVDAIVSGAGLSIQMHTFDGGEVSREVAKTRDPGATYPTAQPAPGDIGNVTVSVPHVELVHGPMLPVLRKAATDATEFSVGHIRRDGAGNRNGLTTYTCLLIRVAPPKGNTMGGATLGTLELEFASNGVNG